MKLKVIVKDAGKKGKGVFAAQPIKKGQAVMSWDLSRKLKHDGLKQLSQYDKDHLNYIGNGEYIVMASPEKYANHSCNPNTYVRNGKDIALRGIRKGEEITTDYSANSLENWQMKCYCGSEYCRGIIKGDFRKLEEKTKKRLQHYLQDWFKQELKLNLDQGKNMTQKIKLSKNFILKIKVYQRKGKYRKR